MLSRGSCACLLAIVEFLLNGRVEVGVCEVYIRHKLAEEGFRALKSALEGFYILRCRVPSSIGGLIISAFVTVH